MAAAGTIQWNKSVIDNMPSATQNSVKYMDKSNRTKGQNNSYIGKLATEAQYIINKRAATYLKKEKLKTDIMDQTNYANTRRKDSADIIWPFWRDIRNIFFSNLLRQSVALKKNKSIFGINLSAALLLYLICKTYEGGTYYLLGQLLYSTSDYLLTLDGNDLLVGENLVGYLTSYITN